MLKDLPKDLTLKRVLITDRDFWGQGCRPQNISTVKVKVRGAGTD
jgi:hypothetical protein